MPIAYGLLMNLVFIIGILMGYSKNRLHERAGIAPGLVC